MENIILDDTEYNANSDSNKSDNDKESKSRKSTIVFFVSKSAFGVEC